MDIHDSEAAILQLRAKIETIKVVARIIVWIFNINHFQASILRRKAEAEMLKKVVEKMRREADFHCMP